MKQARQSKSADAGMAQWENADDAILDSVTSLPKAAPRKRRYKVA
jgi:hypothetical protein